MTKTSYIETKINFSESQKQKIATAYKNKTNITINFKPEDVGGDDAFYFTKGQLSKMQKAFNAGKGVNINLSMAQIKYNTKYGGFLGLLARIGAKALPALLPFAKPAGKALGLGAVSAVGDKLGKKIMGDGLYLVKDGKGLRLETDGSGLFLIPAVAGLAGLLGKAFSGNGLYLVQDGEVQRGGFLAGLIPGAVGEIIKMIS